VRTLDRTIPLAVEMSDTIYAIKVKICEKDGVRPIQQNLFYDTGRLNEERTLADYNIQNEDTVDMMICQCGC
jgi:hypothetical protein